jgi:hypothetical protein
MAGGLASRIGGLEIDIAHLLPRPRDDQERQRLANYWFFLVAICQHTVSLRGTIEGRPLRGWDYLEAASRRCLDAFTASRCQHLTGPELQAIFSDDFDPAKSTLDRVEERLGQLHQCARFLLQEYDGDAMNLYRAAAGRVAGEGGLLQRLARCPPYSDPLYKKSFVLLMMASTAGIWELKDPEALRIPIDYHIMRIALRSGLVEVRDPGLSLHLKERRPATPQLDQRVRSCVEEGCDLLVRASGRSIFLVDMLLWHIGRSCCFYEHEPYCGPRPCPSSDGCTLVKALGHHCQGRCPFDGICRGSREASYREYWETNIYTTYY